jgi:PAS domain-containing protein
MGLKGRYYSNRDLQFIGSLNGEIMGDIIENLVQIFKVSPTETKTNIYGEASADTGKWYLPGIQISALIDRPEMTTEYDDFGPTRNQSHVFKLREKMCIQVNFYPEIGDIIFWNDRYYEISNVTQEQLLGGQPDKSHSIICYGNYTRLSSLNIVERNPS